MNDDHGPELNAIDQQLGELMERFEELDQSCHFRSSMRVAQECRRLAKAEHRLIPYLRATFHVMNCAESVLEPRVRHDLALELMSLLESEDRARAFQSDVREEEYDATKGWMTACAYDNLAASTGTVRGYNSEGMHQCIADGIAVCHRTGKLECVHCFREYATSVYIAADDLDMAMHFATLGARSAVSETADRRYSSEECLSRLLLSCGQLEAAWDSAIRAWRLKDSYHASHMAARSLHLRLIRLSLLLGDPERLRAFESEYRLDEREPVPVGEWPDHDHENAMIDALAAACDGRHEFAIQLLAKWDKLLAEREVLDTWFSTRLDLIAVHRLAGNHRDVERLAKSLEAKATEARDWSTLRLLKRLLDPATPPSPFPTYADFQSGPFAPRRAAVGVDASAAESVEGTARHTPPDEMGGSLADGAREASDQTEDARRRGAASAPVQTEEPELAPVVREIGERLQKLAEAEDEDVFAAEIAAVAATIISVPPESLQRDDDACWLLYFLDKVVARENSVEAWQWGSSVAQRYPQSAGVINLLASLGCGLFYQEDSPLADRLTVEQLEKMYRKSLDLNPNSAGNHLRAGKFYMAEQNWGEAERCFARGFRLQRNNPELALWLADVYRQTDRARDALAALDMCLREGVENAELLWQAALLASGSEPELALTYLARHEALEPDHPWAQYYRATALLDLNRPEEALAATAEEERRNPDCPFGARVLRACALAALGRKTEFVAAADETLGARLRTIDYLTPTGIIHLLMRLSRAAGGIPGCEGHKDRVERRLLETGLAPSELFDERRSAGTPEVDLSCFQVTLRQPLQPATWPVSFCVMPGEESWLAYQVAWGVLARSEDDAVRQALEVQRQCYFLPAEVLDVEVVDEGYTDVPSIVWQGARECLESTGDESDEGGSESTAL